MNHHLIVQILTEIGVLVRKQIYDSLRLQSIEKRSSIFFEGEDDTIYQLDKDVEDSIIPLLNKYAERVGGIILIAEGICETGELTFPENFPKENAQVKIIMDPIDGTRGIMYDKRSAFFLAAASPNIKTASLKSIEVSVMVELPTSRCYLSDTITAIKGKGTKREIYNMLTGEIRESQITPSRSNTIYQGFGQIARFFPPGRNILAAIEEEVISSVFPDFESGKTPVFEDQYISSGGQMYELLVGHDRYIADIRAALYQSNQFMNKKTGHVCHPYDICTVLAAQEAGIVITDILGNEPDYPLDTLSAVNWIGYANKNIQQQVEPALQNAMRKFGLIN